MLTRPETAADETEFEHNRGFQLPALGGEGAAQILAAVRRQRTLVIACVIIFMALGVGFIVQSVPRYTANIAILIDSKKVGMSAQSALEGSLTFESGAVDSQVQVLLSDKIAGVVVDRLGLADNIEFLDRKGSLVTRGLSAVSGGIGRVLAKINGDPPAVKMADLPKETRRILAVQMLQGNVKISRSGRTYVLVVEFTDDDPRLAAAVANAYGEAYLDDQLESKYDATRRASVWMDDRIQELKVKAVDADQAVQNYRSKNNLLLASGRLVNDQALTEANTQLSVARGELASFQARFDRLRSIIEGKQYAATVTESLGSPLINDLRSKYLLASKSESEISAKLGASHQAAESARKEMAQYERLIFSELSRIQQSTQSDVQIAKDKVEALERSLGVMKAASSTDNEAQVKLRALEQEADTYKQLYTAFLQKYQLTTQQESFPVTDARIITPATVPFQRSSPKVILVMGAFTLMGLMTGGALGALREFRERGFRTGTQVRTELGLEFIGNLPFIPRSELRKARKPKSAARPSGDRHLMRVAEPMLSYATDNLLSRYTEGLRATKIAADLAFSNRACVVTGFVSMFPNEGKSTAAKNYASLLASQGHRTLLIDADLRNPELTRALAPNSVEGLIDVLRHNRPIEDLLIEEDATGLKMLPGATHRRVPPGGDLLGTKRMRALIEDLSTRFDQIIVDLPPIGAVTDAAAIARLIDGFVFVVEWGGTPRSIVREALIDEPEIADRTLGVVLSKVNLKRLRFYDAYANYGDAKGYNGLYYTTGA